MGSTRTILLTAPLDLRSTLAPLWRGRGDPTMRMAPNGVWRATRTPEGTGTIHLQHGGSTLRVTAWGAGSEWLLEHAPEIAGLADDPAALETRHPLIRDLSRHHPGVRFTRTLAVMESLVPAIIEQKVTGNEAHRAWRGLAQAYGEPAPGPAGRAGLRVPPNPARLATLPYFAYHPFGLERRRAETIKRAAMDARRLEAITNIPPADAQARLRAVPGIGPWTAAEVAARVLGDPDAVSIGDYHLPNLVAWALAGEPRGTDERMLELLEQFAGQRGRVIKLLEISGLAAQRRGPRYAGRRIETI
ncbi:MAG TPA: hypothetical protein VK656_06795 [Candidatus Acidoferrum sp.]|nr:hypothetical protein [Candidatus Acidoferrum sp.]